MFLRSRRNGKTTLGTSSYRFYNVYLSHNPNVSSDARLKEDINEFDERYIKFFEHIKPRIYKLKSATSEKSKLGGFIAQEIESAMQECGIDKREFGIVKHDTEIDEYALIYDMFIPLSYYYVQFKEKEYQKQFKDILSRLDKLEKGEN